MGDDRPNRYIEDGIVVYRASALGSCLKALTALGLGMTPESHPEWLLEKFQQGIDGEPVVIDKLRTAEPTRWTFVGPTDTTAYQWHDGQIMVEIPVGETAIIRGHLDGIAQCWMKPAERVIPEFGERRVVEVKCCSEDYSKVVLRELPPMYQWQISAYGGWAKLPVLLAVGVKDQDGVVVRVETRLIDVMPWTMAQVKARVCEIERRIARGELGACDYRMFPCQFPWLCDWPEWGGKPGTTDEELEDVLERSIAEVRSRRES